MSDHFGVAPDLSIAARTEGSCQVRQRQLSLRFDG